MKRVLLYFSIGILFGITMIKSEAASWFRIYEMFQFKSFHMYGIIGAAVALGVIITQSIKRFKLRSFFGEEIQIPSKTKLVKAPLFGGVIFGLGWALTGACPGPIYVLIGAGYFPLLIVLVSALLGTYCYGVLKPRLPH
ncbi:MAG: YeeE/YedE family protein [Bacteroidetes bacterium]|nr:YeeE/YedE family protein [Bacteroidota bacterium]